MYTYIHMIRYISCCFYMVKSTRVAYSAMETIMELEKVIQLAA